MKPILIDCPMPITTPRLLIRPPVPGDGEKLNEAVLESFETLHRTMTWATNKPTQDESEEIVRQAAANWILKKDEEPYLPLFICERLGFHLEATLKAKRISPLTGKITDTLVFARDGLSDIPDLTVSWGNQYE